MENNEKKAEIGETAENAPKKKVNSVGHEIFEWVYTIVIAVAIALFVKAFLFDVVRVDGSSMHPTLVNNDRLIVTKLGYKPKQGDIVILDSTYKNREKYFESAAEKQGEEKLSAFEKFKVSRTMPANLKKKYYVKRIIALPGQTVDLVNGKVYVDGEELDEPYYSGITQSIDAAVEYPVTVEDDMVFVMGDIRPHSKDSRSSELGQVPFEAVLGKSQVRIWPLNALGLTR